MDRRTFLETTVATAATLALPTISIAKDVPLTERWKSLLNGIPAYRQEAVACALENQRIWNESEYAKQFPYFTRISVPLVRRVMADERIQAAINLPMRCNQLGYNSYTSLKVDLDCRVKPIVYNDHDVQLVSILADELLSKMIDRDWCDRPDRLGIKFYHFGIIKTGQHEGIITIKCNMYKQGDWVRYSSCRFV